MKRLICLATLLVAAGAATAAPDDKAAAEALVTRGVELRREGKNLEALEMLQKAHAIAPSPRTFGQLGLAEAAVEHWADSEEHLTGALASPEDPWVRKTHATLEQALNLAAGHVGQIAVTGPAGAAIIIAGKSVGSLPLAKAVRVNAGPALVSATAPGFYPFEMSVPVEAGKETQLKVALVASQPPPAPPPPATVQAAAPGTDLRAHSAWKTWTGTSLVAGGAAVAAFGIVWIAVDGHATSGACSAGAPPGCKPVYDTKTPGIVLTAAGAAAAVGGGILLYSAKTRSSELGVALGPSSLLVRGQF
jgi:hypothetical protein